MYTQNVVDDAVTSSFCSIHAFKIHAIMRYSSIYLNSGQIYNIVRILNLVDSNIRQLNNYVDRCSKYAQKTNKIRIIISDKG